MRLVDDMHSEPFVEKSGFSLKSQESLKISVPTFNKFAGSARLASCSRLLGRGWRSSRGILK